MFSNDDLATDDFDLPVTAYSNDDLPWFDTLDANKFARECESWGIQTTDFTCAIMSQKMILSQFGIELSEAQLVYEATSGGFLTSDGTSPEDMGRLLEAHGVSTHQAFGLENLLIDLASGHKVIVAVNSGELWGKDWFLDVHGADHALVVNGLDLSDPSNPQAVLNDPGHPNGAGMRVPLDQFLDAWDDSGQFYVATDDAPPNLASDPILGAGYDTESGMYMNQNFWERFVEAREALLGHLFQNLSHVSDRFMHEGALSGEHASAVIKSVTASMGNMTDTERNELLREI